MERFFKEARVIYCQCGRIAEAKLRDKWMCRMCIFELNNFEKPGPATDGKANTVPEVVGDCRPIPAGQCDTTQSVGDKKQLKLF